MQSEWIYNNNKSENFFSNNLENNNQQKIQHTLLINQAMGYGSHKQNIFDELKKEQNLEKINLSLLILKEW